MRLKKIWSGILLVVLLLSFSTTAFAASGNTYKLDELGMSIDIPSDYVVFTRNISASDPNLSAYGLTKSDMYSLMTSRNIYLNAWDEDVNFEIIVTMIDSPLSDFNECSDTILTTLASSFESEYKSAGITVSDYEVYQHSQAKFLKIYISQPNGSATAYGLQYYTVYDGKAINVTMQSYSGRIDSSKETIIKSIVDTVKFDKAPEKTQTVETTSSFVYKDEETGSEFTVPENWSKGELSKNRETLDVKFTSNLEAGLSILYGSTDIWGQMSASERQGYSRSDYDNSIFTASEIAEIMGVSSSQVSKVTYGNKDYYKVETKSSTSSYGIDLNVTMTSMIRIDNGYMYLFQFAGDSKNSYYKDFESLLASVKYSGSSNSSSNSSFEFSFVNIIFSLLMTIAIYSLPIIIYRYAILKHPVDKSKAKKITIIYGIIAFIVMSIVLVALNGSGATAGGAIILWSWVNYSVLQKGKKKTIEDDPQKEEQVVLPKNDEIKIVTATNVEKEEEKPPVEIKKVEPIVPIKTEIQHVEEPKKEEPIQDISEVVFCYKCGTKLNTNMQFCHKCGTKIVKGGN